MKRGNTVKRGITVKTGFQAKISLVAAALLLGLAAVPLAAAPASAEETPGPGAGPSPSSEVTPADEPSPSDEASPTAPGSGSESPEPDPSPTVDPPASLEDLPPSEPSEPSAPSEPPAPAFTTEGAIGAKWLDLGGAGGVLGEPISTQYCAESGLCQQKFAGGLIYWTSADGAHAVFSATGHTGPGFFSGGGLAAFGYPLGDETAAPGGTVQKFSGGKILAWNGTAVFRIWSRGAIGGFWTALGSSAGLGMPLSNESCGLRNGGCFQAFSRGTIYWSPATGPRFVRGAIQTRWKSVGAQDSVMGYPVTSEICGQPASGCVQRFQGGNIYWSPGSGVWVVRGAIGGQYAAAGATRGLLAYPLSNEKCASGKCIQNFQGGFIGWEGHAGTRIYSKGTECQALNNGKSKYSSYGANRVLLTVARDYKVSRSTSIYCKRLAGTYVPDWKTDSYVGASGFKPPGVPSGPTRYLFSPTGSFSVTEAFGLGNPGTKLAYRTLNPRSRWGGNPWTATYNKYFESSSWVGWDENMWYYATRASHDYRQGVVINYNRPNIVQNAGFAIFLHMNKVPTAGCISLDDWAVLDYLKKSTPGDRIIMGTYRDLFR
ncbi:hypothetical protein [Arthrobacter sp. R-11]|uniref:hypothetical protein n=1 Tax=Arthrobacter sp. R-11 TaxID=3404053 RepID=UPI003CF4CD89